MLTRDWTKEDIAEISALEKVCFSDPWSEQTFLAAFSSPYFAGVLIEDNGKIAAYACASVLFEDAEIGAVAVAPEYRSKGLGKTVLCELEKRVKEKGAERIFLEVRVSNESALGLYRGAGFEAFGVRKKYYADGEDAFVMRKELGASAR
ncbi:MAG: ribosomal protein S18-alanine N-acetyltransferase [Clostridia bacterium]|nr:ribosomal protein S18-alanine N-acetyltransferase [Clostridia bacterium]